MSRLLLVCVLLLAVGVPLLAFAANPPSPPQPGILPPTAPIADFNEPDQSSWAIVRAMHIRGPEKILAVVVLTLLVIALLMFIGMLRHVYAGPGARRP